MLRISENMLGTTLRNDLQRVQGQLLQTQQELATGKRIQEPSNHPVGTENVLQWDSALAQNAQDQTNAQDAQSWLTSGSSALSDAVSLLQQVRSNALSAGAGDLTQNQIQDIAAQVHAALGGLAEVANTKVGANYIFSGDQTNTAAFAKSASGAYTYQGGTGTIQRDLAPGVHIPVNLSGNTVFTPAFTAISNILTDLGSGGTLSKVTGSDLTQLDAAISGLTNAEGQLGGRMQQVTAAQGQLTAIETTLKQLRAGTLDTNTAGAVIQLQQLQVNYQSALSVGAQLMQQTLAHYLP